MKEVKGRNDGCYNCQKLEAENKTLRRKIKELEKQLSAKRGDIRNEG